MAKKYPCSKVRYRDKLSAKIALATARNGRSSRREERRYYRCPDCLGWHLTSKPGKAQ